MIEMLVVLVLTALMSAMMLGTIRQMQHWRHVEQRALRQAELDTLADFMAAEIGGALNLPLLHRGGEDPVSLVGSSDRVTFVAVLRTGFDIRRLVEAQYSLNGSATPPIVSRLVWQHRPPVNDSMSAQAEELYRGAETIRFRYLAGKEGEPRVWQDSWRASGQLPVAVQVELQSRVESGLILARRVAILAQ